MDQKQTRHPATQWAMMAMMSAMMAGVPTAIRSTLSSDHNKVGPRNAKALRARKKRERHNRKRGRR
jgi:hypothetical protein